MTQGTGSAELTLRFSHNVIEHLGLKLYQNKPTNVIAELVSNCWDAHARNVWIAVKSNDDSHPICISVADDGYGMDEGALIDDYLVVGKPKPGARDVASEGDSATRKPMGRKGIGKLAPFGIAKKVDVLTVKGRVATWLRFDYPAMLSATTHADGGVSIYSPAIVARGEDISAIDPGLANENSDLVAQFIQGISGEGHGTLVLCSDLTLRRAVPLQSLREALGRRFTVTLMRDDFTVHVDGQKLTESEAFPQWDLRIPSEGFATETISTPIGNKDVRYWVGYVRSAAWPVDQTGVGVYAHGKIAQDRPFLFGDKGNEIFSRYIYGVVEADWVDELDHDTISTDRTSIDWEDSDLASFYSWGAAKVKTWMSAYQAHRAQTARTEDRATVDKLMGRPELKLRDSEKNHLLDLLQEITPKLARDDAQKEKFVEATVRAWVHDPARKLIKKLWEDASKFNEPSFNSTVARLADELVPESLSLGVAFAQRIFALTQLSGHILQGKETQLQQLIEEFPWILNDQFERFSARKALSTIVSEAVEDGSLAKRAPFAPIPADRTKPDFVFFGTAEDKEILVVELKGPSDTAQFEEFEQLRAYVTYLKSRFTDSDVRGILVARDHSPSMDGLVPPIITFEKWDTLLMRSRRAHAELLEAMLVGADPAPDDARVRQICELGGDVVRDFLTQMSARDSRLRDLVQKLAPVKGSPAPQVPNV